jgi:hypothetical protein
MQGSEPHAAFNSDDRFTRLYFNMTSSPLPSSSNMFCHLEVENALSARHVDVDDEAHLVACCKDHEVAEAKLRAMIDVIRPLSDSFSVYFTK